MLSTLLKAAVEWQVIEESSDRKSGGDAERAPDAVAGSVVKIDGLWYMDT